MGCGFSSSAKSHATFSDYHNQPNELSVMVTTFNVGEKEPPESGFKGWFSPNMDVYVVGFQESAMKPAAVASWLNSLTAFLISVSNAGSKYNLIAHQLSGQMVLAVIAKGRKGGSGAPGDLKISHVKISKENTGLGHVYANKGGVGIGVTVNATRFLFVSSHLAAHQEKVKKRNDDYKEITMGLDLGNKFIDSTNDADFVFWCGDLNYRINESREDCLRLIEEGEKGIRRLRKNDQLNIERGEGNVFVGFDEPELHFPPTYKFELGSREYTVEKARVPSWCDRILFKAQDPLAIIPVEYNCVNHITMSDHSPVFGKYIIKPKLGVLQHLPVPHPLHGIKLHFKALRGHDLIAKDFNGASDPYITFWAPWLPYNVKKPIKTQIKKVTTAPVWTEKEVPVLNIMDTDINVLLDHPLTLAVMDYDLGNADDRMGQGSLSLRSVLEAGEKTMFRIPLIADGLPAGSLSGEITVTDSSGNNVKLKRGALVTWKPNLRGARPLPLQPGTGHSKKGVMRKKDSYDGYLHYGGSDSSSGEDYAPLTDKQKAKLPAKNKPGEKSKEKSKEKSIVKKDGKASKSSRRRSDDEEDDDEVEEGRGVYDDGTFDRSHANSLNSEDNRSFAASEEISSERDRPITRSLSQLFYDDEDDEEYDYGKDGENSFQGSSEAEERDFPKGKMTRQANVMYEYEYYDSDEE